MSRPERFWMWWEGLSARSPMFTPHLKPQMPSLSWFLPYWPFCSLETPHPHHCSPFLECPIPPPTRLCSAFTSTSPNVLSSLRSSLLEKAVQAGPGQGGFSSVGSLTSQVSQLPWSVMNLQSFVVGVWRFPLSWEPSDRLSWFCSCLSFSPRRKQSCSVNTADMVGYLVFCSWTWAGRWNTVRSRHWDGPVCAEFEVHTLVCWGELSSESRTSLQHRAVEL